MTISTTSKLVVVDVKEDGKPVREREHGMQDVLNFLSYKDIDILFPLDGPVSFYNSKDTKDKKGVIHKLLFTRLGVTGSEDTTMTKLKVNLL